MYHECILDAFSVVIAQRYSTYYIRSHRIAEFRSMLLELVCELTRLVNPLPANKRRRLANLYPFSIRPIHITSLHLDHVLSLAPCSTLSLPRSVKV